MNQAISQNKHLIIKQPDLQKGLVTTFTGVMILVLLTLMMFFAMRVGVFEQRVSANDSRQKLAFHTAESGIQHAKEFLRANSVLVSSYTVDLLPNNTDGWLANSAEKRWQKCSDAGLDLGSGHGSHPCFGEPTPGRRSQLYYYSFAGSTEMPVDTDTVLPGSTETVAVEALLCVLNIDETATIPVQGCSTDPAVADGSHFMVTLLARGNTDCSGGVCNAEALVSEQVSNFGAGSGGNAPSVPLTTKSSFPPSGTAEVIPNPNSGGIGVPVSVWMNANTSCSADGSIIDPSSGSWATCEMHEWYETDKIPDGVACTGNCSCSQGESISYTHGNSDVLGIDLVQDPDFPCDLFQFYFGVPRASYEIVKGFSKIISDCTSLGPNSFGIYWVSGSSCRINSNTQVGSPNAPVMLISAASETVLNGGAEIFGVLYITDTEDSDAELQSKGNNTVYGSVIVDGVLGSYQGTFQVVWNENATEKAPGGGGLGSVIGGWSDFHRDWE